MYFLEDSLKMAVGLSITLVFTFLLRGVTVTIGNNVYAALYSHTEEVDSKIQEYNVEGLEQKIHTPHDFDTEGD